MKRILPIALILVVSFMFSGCIFHSQAAKENAARIKIRSAAMLKAREDGRNLDLIYYKEMVIDAELNQKELGTPKKTIDITDHVEVANSQKTLMKQQEAKSILASVGVNVVGAVAGFLGLGGLFVKVKNSFKKAKDFGEAAAERAGKVTDLHGALVKGVDKYKDKFDDVVSRLPIADDVKAKIHDVIGKEKLYQILGAEANKTGYGSDHHKMVEEIKNSII